MDGWGRGGVNAILTHSPTFVKPRLGIIFCDARISQEKQSQRKVHLRRRPPLRESASLPVREGLGEGAGRRARVPTPPLIVYALFLFAKKHTHTLFTLVVKTHQNEIILNALQNSIFCRISVQTSLMHKSEKGRSWDGGGPRAGRKGTMC